MHNYINLNLFKLQNEFNIANEQNVAVDVRGFGNMLFLNPSRRIKHVSDKGD